MKYTRAKILSNKKIVDGIYEMVVAEDSIVKPGQFYMLKHQGGTLLPRPISISESKDGKITFAPNDDKSELVTNVVNKKGSTLPSTGGIGTTIFTIAGCLIMIAAAGLFFATRRKTQK